MKEIIRDRWFSDLLSGEFEQAHGSFLDGDLHCCLAVLTRQAEREGWVKFKDDGTLLTAPCLLEHDHDDPGYCEFNKDVPVDDWDFYEQGDLPPVVQWWSGLNSPDPLLPGKFDGDIPNSAINCNDVREESFERIAQRVRRL